MPESSENRGHTPRHPYDYSLGEQSSTPTYGAITGEDNLGDLDPAMVIMPGFGDDASLADALTILLVVDLFRVILAPIPPVAGNNAAFDGLAAHHRRQRRERFDAMRAGERLGPLWHSHDVAAAIRRGPLFLGLLAQDMPTNSTNPDD